MDFMLAFWCSLAICGPFIIRFLKIIIHIAITSRIIDNKLDNWRSGSSFSDSSNICSITFLENTPAPQQTDCFAQFWLNLLPSTAQFRPGWRPSVLCNQITASSSSTIEWKNVIYLGNGQNKPWERRDCGLSRLCAASEKRRKDKWFCCCKIIRFRYVMCNRDPVSHVRTQFTGVMGSLGQQLINIYDGRGL